MSDYITGETRWLRYAESWDAFWSELTAYPAGRGIRLHLRDGNSDHGPFVGSGEASGFAYSPEPDGYASIEASDSDVPRMHLRVNIVGFTPLE